MFYFLKITLERAYLFGAGISGTPQTSGFHSYIGIPCNASIVFTWFHWALLGTLLHCYALQPFAGLHYSRLFFSHHGFIERNAPKNSWCSGCFLPFLLTHVDLMEPRFLLDQTTAADLCLVITNWTGLLLLIHVWCFAIGLYCSYSDN